MKGPGHTETCRWARTTDTECAYKATHHYCPHEAHACDCPGTWPEPTSMEDYERRYGALSGAGALLSGRGLQETRTHIPCPFCAAPNFLVFRIIDGVEAAYNAGATCTHCHRSAKLPVTRTAHSLSFEVVQTGGPDQPTWLTPQMRRV